MLLDVKSILKGSKVTHDIVVFFIKFYLQLSGWNVKSKVGNEVQ